MQLIAALLLGLGDTPEKTFEEVKKAAQARDMGALIDAFAPVDQKEMEQQWEEQKKHMAGPDGEEQLKRLAAMLGVPEKEALKVPYREFMVKVMKQTAERDPESFDREFAKFTRGVVARKKVEGDVCVLTVKTGDREEDVELAQDGGKWHLSLAPKRRASQERNASARLMTIAAAQADFRSNDRDEDQIRSFWVKDIAGLYGLEGKGGAVKLIELQVAQADRTEGRGKYRTVEEEKPAAGYCFASLKRYRRDGKAVSYDDGSGRNSSRWAAVAWPAQYPQNGRSTFILGWDGTIYSKDTGGKPMDEYPEDPAREGWKAFR